jgi:hypothetical protein
MSMESGRNMTCSITINNEMSQFMKVMYRMILKMSAQKLLIIHL